MKRPNPKLRRGVMMAGCAMVMSTWHIGCATPDRHRSSGDQTMEKQVELPAINPEEARRLLESDSGYIYLDVRTPAEFQPGRPAGAINIPIATPNPTTGDMELNDAFLIVATAHIPKAAKVIVGCRSGQRSAKAQELMHQAGYTNTVNMRGGFSGSADATGQVLVEGWSTLGYPVERGEAGDAGYEALSSKSAQ